MPPLIALKTINECALYLKPLPSGSKCILLGGPILANRTREQFRRRGLIVTLSGEYGNRTVTSEAIDTTLVDKYSDWRSSKNKDGVSITLFEAGGKTLLPGESVFANGSHATMIRELRKAYGAGCYSCSKATDPKYGVGWMVKHLTKEEQEKQIELRRSHDERRIRGATIVADLNSRMSTAKAMGTGIEIGASVFVQSPRVKIRDHLSLRFKPQTFSIEPANHETYGDCFKVTRIS